MRTSAGFCEIGLSGKTRIQMRPPRLMWRLIARRADSIWRAVSRPRPVAFRPNSPNETLVPRVARPVLRPLCSLRYFLRDGCSMIILLQAPARLRPCAGRGHGRPDGRHPDARRGARGADGALLREAPRFP